jgi:hypothetical protein
MPKTPPKINTPTPDKPWDREGLELERNVSLREQRKEGRPDDPTTDGMPVKNSQPHKNLKAYR